jgi:hypothetical protein
MLAVAHDGLKDKYPLGCAFVVQHLDTAADAYDELKFTMRSFWTSPRSAST